MTIILDHANLTDAWAVSHPGSSGFNPTTALEAVEQLGITADNTHNTWSAGKTYITGWGKRLDYVLYRQPAGNQSRSDVPIPVLRAIQSKVIFTDHVPGHNFSYSDHFGLEATLAIETTPVDAPVVIETPKELSSAAIATTIQAWTACYRFAKERMQKELIGAGVAFVSCIAIAIGTAWLPYSWLTPIFIVLTILLAWTCTTFFYHGFLYGNWECNALQGAIEELEHHRTGLQLLGAPGHQRSPSF